MNTVAKKSVALLLILTLMLSAAVPVFAVSADTQSTPSAYTDEVVLDEYTPDRPGFLGFLDYLYNTPVLRVLFAPLIAVVELIFYISVWFAMR